MTALRHLLLTLRCAQTAMCVRVAERSIAIAKRDLADALAAHDAAVAAWHIAMHDEQQASAVPVYLQRKAR